MSKKARTMSKYSFFEKNMKKAMTFDQFYRIGGTSMWYHLEVEVPPCCTTLCEWEEVIHTFLNALYLKWGNDPVQMGERQRFKVWIQALKLLKIWWFHVLKTERLTFQNWYRHDSGIKKWRPEMKWNNTCYQSFWGVIATITSFLEGA